MQSGEVPRGTKKKGGKEREEKKGKERKGRGKIEKDRGVLMNMVSATKFLGLIININSCL